MAENINIWTMFGAKGKYFLKGCKHFLKDARRPHLIVMEKFYEAFENVSDVLNHESTHVVFDHGNPEVLWLRHKDVLHNIQAWQASECPRILIDHRDTPPTFLLTEESYTQAAKIAKDRIEECTGPF